MERTLYSDLRKWKNSKVRKPLLLQGARQVGKTYLVSQFGKSEYSDFVYLNFEQNPLAHELFKDNLDSRVIVDKISLYFGRKVNPDDTLIFFDEIQVVPAALTSLKYFNEEANEYHIIAAGSLLGTSIGKQSSFPVGKVNFLKLFPLSFMEYLNAIGEQLLLEYVKNNNKAEALPEIFHHKLIQHLKMYLYCGGMPEVVQDYIKNNDIASVRKIQNEILDAYKRDFSKYTDKSQAIKTSEVWNSTPRQLAKENKKFKYNDVRKNARAAMYVDTTEWLRNAGLINIAFNISTPKIPLSAYADYSKFKIYLHDTGLLAAMLNITSDLIIEPTKIFSEFNGAFIENFISQELIAYGYKDLFYWTSRSDAEVDFILQIQNQIFPVEVKSGTSRNLKSLRSYEEKYKPELLFRLSPRNIIQSHNFINLPLYACFLIEKYT